MLLLALFLTARAPGLTAQTEYYARLGAVGATNLLHDVIVSEITVRQSIAPMLALGGSLPIGPKGYRAGLEGTLASGKYHSSENGARTDLGTLRTGTLLVDAPTFTTRPGFIGPFVWLFLRWSFAYRQRIYRRRFGAGAASDQGPRGL